MKAHKLGLILVLLTLFSSCATGYHGYYNSRGYWYHTHYRHF